MDKQVALELNQTVTIETVIGGFVMTYPKIVGWQTVQDPIIEYVKEAFTSQPKLLKRIKDLYTPIIPEPSQEQA